MIFQSKRLNYRRLDSNDWKLYYELYSNKDVMKFTYHNAFLTIEEAKKSFDNVLSMQLDDSQGTQYVATLSNNAAIGIVDYDVILKNSEGGVIEIGYFIMPEYWGVGYATEMSRALIEYVFTNSNIHKVVASCNSSNLSSENIMRKLGMTYEGKLRKVRYKDGGWADETKYGLLREEWSLQSGE